MFCNLGFGFPLFKMGGGTGDLGTSLRKHSSYYQNISSSSLYSFAVVR